MKGLTTNYARLAAMAPKRNKRKNKSAKLQIVERIEKVWKAKQYRLPTERELLRKLDDWS